MRIRTIDGVNYVRQEIPTADGTKVLEGLTVRAMRQLLADADPDAMIVYVAEQNEGLLFGCIAGAGMDSGNGTNICMLFGPEAVGPLKTLVGKEL